MDELPYRAIVDLDAPLFGQLGHKAPQREVAGRPFQKPVAMLAAQSLQLVTTDLARGNAARLARTTNPFDRRTRRNTKNGPPPRGATSRPAQPRQPPARAGPS